MMPQGRGRSKLRDFGRAPAGFMWGARGPMRDRDERARGRPSETFEARQAPLGSRTEFRSSP